MRIAEQLFLQFCKYLFLAVVVFLVLRKAAVRFGIHWWWWWNNNRSWLGLGLVLCLDAEVGEVDRLLTIGACKCQVFSVVGIINIDDIKWMSMALTTKVDTIHLFGKRFHQIPLSVLVFVCVAHEHNAWCIRCLASEIAIVSIIDESLARRIAFAVSQALGIRLVFLSTDNVLLVCDTWRSFQECVVGELVLVEVCFSFWLGQDALVDVWTRSISLLEEGSPSLLSMLQRKSQSRISCQHQ